MSKSTPSSPELAKAYIYKLVDPSTRLVGYIGQTSDPVRRYWQHLRMHYTDAPKKNAWIADCLVRGVEPEMVILQEVTPKDADKYEAFWIAHYLDCGYSLSNDDLKGVGQFLRLTRDQILAKARLEKAFKSFRTIEAPKWSQLPLWNKELE